MTGEQSPQEYPPSDEMAMGAGEDAQPSEPFEGGAQSEAGGAAKPGETLAAAGEGEGGFGASVWLQNKKISALWSINQNRNSWIGVAGVGWKRLATDSDSAIVALTMLSAHAKQMDRVVNLREDSGQIKEIYVW